MTPVTNFGSTTLKKVSKLNSYKFFLRQQAIKYSLYLGTTACHLDHRPFTIINLRCHVNPKKNYITKHRARDGSDDLL